MINTQTVPKAHSQSEILPECWWFYTSAASDACDKFHVCVTCVSVFLFSFQLLPIPILGAVFLMSEFSSRTLSSFYKNLSLSLLPNPLLEMFCQMDLSSSFIFIFSSWQILVPKSIKTQQPCCDLMLNKEDLLPDYPALKIESNIITMSPQLPRFKTKCAVCVWSIFF